MGTIFCPFCGTQVPVTETNCTKCGAHLEGDARGSTLMGMSALKAKESLKREMEKAKKQKPAKEAKEDPSAPQLRSFSEATAKETAPEAKSGDDLDDPNAVTPYEGNSWVMEGASEKGRPASGEWSAGASPASDYPLEEGSAGDSIMLRPGDLVDPVTGLPLRAFMPKPRSKLPYLIFGLLMVGIAALGAYVFTRPEPPPTLQVASESLSLLGEGAYELVLDGSKIVGVQAVRVKEIEARFLEGAQARLSLPENAVPLGKSELPVEVQIDGEWREATPLKLSRPASVRATVDNKRDILVLEFTLVEGGTSVKLQEEEGMASGGKARVEIPLRKLATPEEKGEITRNLSFEVGGVKEAGQLTVKIPPPQPALTVKAPKDYTVVEKGVEEILLELKGAPDAKITVTVNKNPLSPKDQKYLVPLKPEENVIEVKAELDGAVAGEETIRVFRGRAPEGWETSGGGGKKTP